VNPDAEDRLEPAALRTATVIAVGLGVLVFLALALPAMALFYRLEAGSRAISPAPVAPPKGFPAPQLEISIDPRRYPAAGPGPAAPTTPARPAPDEAALPRAMAAIAAKGAHAYDPLPAPTPAKQSSGPQ
jgi:hypothetical protein